MAKTVFRKIFSNTACFGFSQEIIKANVIFTFLFHVSLLAAVYPNLLFLIPRFLGKKQNVRYLFFTTLLVGVAFCSTSFPSSVL